VRLGYKGTGIFHLMLRCFCRRRYLRSLTSKGAMYVAPRQHVAHQCAECPAHHPPFALHRHPPRYPKEPCCSPYCTCPLDEPHLERCFGLFPTHCLDRAHRPLLRDNMRIHQSHNANSSVSFEANFYRFLKGVDVQGDGVTVPKDFLLKISHPSQS
jgi:hypothetical protein